MEVGIVYDLTSLTGVMRCNFIVLSATFLGWRCPLFPEYAGSEERIAEMTKKAATEGSKLLIK